LDYASPNHQIPIIEELSLGKERILQENSKPVIEIGPSKVKNDEDSMQILYLSTSMGLTMSENVTFSTGLHKSIH